MYSSYSFTTLPLDVDERSASRPGRSLPPGKGTPVPIEQEAGWAPEPVWTQRLEEKSLASAEDQTYTDKCPYEMQEQMEDPVWYTGIYRPIWSTAYRN
jgi:hypothetical protein